MRTIRETVTFDRPFSLYAVDDVQPAGTHTVETDAELIEGVSFRLSTGGDHDLPAAPLRRAWLVAGRQSQSA